MRALEVLRDEERTPRLRLLIESPVGFSRLPPSDSCRLLLPLLFFVLLGRHVGVPDDRFSPLGGTVIVLLHRTRYGAPTATADERRCSARGAVFPRPRRRAPLWFGRVLPHVLNGLLISAFTLTFGSLTAIGRIPLESVGRLVAVLRAASVGCSVSGLAPGGLGPRSRGFLLVPDVAGFVPHQLTGVNVAREILPGWTRAVGEVLPLAHRAGAHTGWAAHRQAARHRPAAVPGSAPGRSTRCPDDVLEVRRELRGVVITPPEPAGEAVHLAFALPTFRHGSLPLLGIRCPEHSRCDACGRGTAMESVSAVFAGTAFALFGAALLVWTGARVIQRAPVAHGVSPVASTALATLFGLGFLALGVWCFNRL